MFRIFDGKRIRDEVLTELKATISRNEKRPVLAVILIGNDPVSVSYVELKQRVAQSVGIDCRVFRYDATMPQQEIIQNIEGLNDDESVLGIMVQIPIPEGFDRVKIIEAIVSSKDVDGLRYCQGLESNFVPPVVCAIDKALELSEVDMAKVSLAIIGHGFLVGNPLERYLKNRVKRLIIADSDTEDLSSITRYADVIISATGSASLIKPDMVRDGVVLIDAGTSEVGGKMVGDIDPETYTRSSYYTPVPGGIGPVTVAYLLKNVVDSLV